MTLFSVFSFHMGFFIVNIGFFVVVNGYSEGGNVRIILGNVLSI